MRLSPLSPVLPYGEVVTINKAVLRRSRKAVRGFVLPTHPRQTRRLRRRNRDTNQRKRRARRAKRASRRAVIRNTKHWSEKKDQRFRNTAYSHRKLGYTKTFVKKLRGKFAARAGVATFSARVFNTPRLAALMQRPTEALVRAQKAPASAAPTATTLSNASSAHR